MTHAKGETSTRPDEAERQRADDRGPDSPAQLTKRSWIYVLRKTVREFSADQCTDLAAALTYYAVLALFPAAIALTSLLGLVGKGTDAVTTVLDIVRDLGGGSVVETVRDPMLEISRPPPARPAPCGRAGPRRRPARSPVVGERVRRGVRARDDPRLRDRGGPAGLEAPP